MFLNSLNIPASGLTAQQYRLNIISQNITNAETTRTASGEGPYRRKTPVFESISDSRDRKNFKEYLNCSHTNRNNSYAYGYSSPDAGVRVKSVIEDPSPNKMVYNPEHPDANEEGYVAMPNVEMVQEMVDMMGASRSYEANIQVINAIKAMAQKALEIGR